MFGNIYHTEELVKTQARELGSMPEAMAVTRLAIAEPKGDPGSRRIGVGQMIWLRELITAVRPVR